MKPAPMMYQSSFYPQASVVKSQTSPRYLFKQNPLPLKLAETLAQANSSTIKGPGSPCSARNCKQGENLFDVTNLFSRGDQQLNSISGLANEAGPVEVMIYKQFVSRVVQKSRELRPDLGLREKLPAIQEFFFQSKINYLLIKQVIKLKATADFFQPVVAEWGTGESEEYKIFVENAAKWTDTTILKLAGAVIKVVIDSTAEKLGESHKLFVQAIRREINNSINEILPVANAKLSEMESSLSVKELYLFRISADREPYGSDDGKKSGTVSTIFRHCAALSCYSERPVADKTKQIVIEKMATSRECSHDTQVSQVVESSANEMAKQDLISHVKPAALDTLRTFLPIDATVSKMVSKYSADKALTPNDPLTLSAITPDNPCLETPCFEGAEEVLKKALPPSQKKDTRSSTAITSDRKAQHLELINKKTLGSLRLEKELHLNETNKNLALRDEIPILNLATNVISPKVLADANFTRDQKLADLIKSIKKTERQILFGTIGDFIDDHYLKIAKGNNLSKIVTFLMEDEVSISVFNKFTNFKSCKEYLANAKNKPDRHERRLISRIKKSQALLTEFLQVSSSNRGSVKAIKIMKLKWRAFVSEVNAATSLS